MQTLKFLNNNTSLILNNQFIYTIDKKFSTNPAKFIKFSDTIYYYQGEIIEE